MSIRTEKKNQWSKPMHRYASRPMIGKPLCGRKAESKSLYGTHLFNISVRGHGTHL
jgi:hypothetical protein